MMGILNKKKKSFYVMCPTSTETFEKKFQFFLTKEDRSGILMLKN